MFGPLVYLTALGLAFVYPPLSLMICAGLAVFFALPYRGRRGAA
jgi:hypothetical protein